MVAFGLIDLIFIGAFVAAPCIAIFVSWIISCSLTRNASVSGISQIPRASTADGRGSVQLQAMIKSDLDTSVSYAKTNRTASRQSEISHLEENRPRLNSFMKPTSPGGTIRRDEQAVPVQAPARPTFFPMPTEAPPRPSNPHPGTRPPPPTGPPPEDYYDMTDDVRRV